MRIPFNASILESILTQYKQQEDVISNIAKTDPQNLKNAITALHRHRYSLH